jgi:hypothetical protein
MAKSIHFKGSNVDFTAGIVKVDRKKIYGYSKIEVKDEHGNLCSLASLSDDGSHILPSGSSGIAKFDSENNFIENADIMAVDIDGKPAQLVPGIFEQVVELKKTDNIADYLDLNVKGIYQLIVESENKKALMDSLKGNLMSFIFNYRTDYEGDDAFLIVSDNEIFVVVGNKCEFEYIGLEELITEDDNEEELDDFDFGML